MKPRKGLHIEDEPKRKRKKRKADTAYNPKGQKRRKKNAEAASRDVLHMRTDNAKFAHKDVALKTSALIDAAIFPDDMGVLNEAHAHFTTQLTNISSYRPVYSVIEYSLSGSPLKVETPEGKTLLSRTVKIGPLSHFANAPHLILPEITTQTHLADTDAFQQTLECQALKEIQQEYKLQDITITPQLLKNTQKAHTKNQGRRPISQQQAMSSTDKGSKAASADTHAQATQLFSQNMRWDWLHLIAYMILGHVSQKAENLVAGTVFANTNMMFIEAEMKYLAEKYPNGFQLTVNAHLIPGTHLAIQIEYTITTVDFTLPLTFDAQHPVKPHISLRDYMHSLVATLVEKGKANEKNTDAMPVSPSKVNFPFFQKKPEVNDLKVKSQTVENPSKKSSS